MISLVSVLAVAALLLWLVLLGGDMRRHKVLETVLWIVFVVMLVVVYAMTARAQREPETPYAPILRPPPPVILDVVEIRPSPRPTREEPRR